MMHDVKDEGGPQVEAPETVPMEEAVEPPRRASVSVDSQPIRAASRIEVSSVELPPASLEQRFDVDARLGRGGMGTVQRARDKRLLRDVAVKIIHGHLDWGAHQARFAREAQITAQLQHPNIVPVYSFERSGEGGSAIVMQLVEGQTLHSFLRDCRDAAEKGLDDQPPHDLNSRLELLIKTCDAVQYAHDHGVVHRDIKPANIMLGEHGEVYLMDWGLAGLTDVPDEPLDTEHEGPESEVSPEPVAVGEPQSGARARASAGPGLTREGDIFGTPQYMSPEQARGETALMGPATDQFALGLILFDLAFLKPPRVQRADSNLMGAAALGLTEPREHFAGREVPSSLVAVLSKATAREPEDRYPSVRAFAEDLRRFQRGAPPKVVRESALQRAWRRFNQNPVRAMRTALAVLLALFLTISGSLWLQLRAERTASLEKERVAGVSAAVGDRTQHIEHALGEVEALVQGWAKAAEQALAHSDALPIEALEVHALRAAGKSEGLKYSARHGQSVSYKRASYVVAPDSDMERVQEQLGRIAHLRPYLRRWLSGGEVTRGPAAGADGDHIPILWIYLALESGVLVTYPGNVNYPDDYDPRERPWYQDALHGTTAGWQAPYRSMSGGEIQLPCVAALVDKEGALFGVVGMDLALSDLREHMRMAEDPAWRASWLLDDEAHVLASTTIDLGGQAPANNLSGRGVDLAPFAEAEVRAAVLEDNAGGALEQGNRLYVLQRLRSQGWTLVVSFDREQVFDTDLL